jgi:hypothetical protein
MSTSEFLDLFLHDGTPKTIFHFPRNTAYEENLYRPEKVHSGDPCIATGDTAV